MVDTAQAVSGQMGGQMGADDLLADRVRWRRVWQGGRRRELSFLVANMHSDVTIGLVCPYT